MASKKTRKGDKSGNAQDADSDESARDDAPTPTHEMQHTTHSTTNALTLANNIPIPMDGNAEFYYKLTKSDSQSSIDQQGPEKQQSKKLQQSSSGSGQKRSAAGVSSSHCANNRREEAAVGPRNSLSLNIADPKQKQTGGGTTPPMLLSEMNTRPRGATLCKKKASLNNASPENGAAETMVRNEGIEGLLLPVNPPHQRGGAERPVAAAFPCQNDCSTGENNNVLGWQAACQTTGERLAHMLMNESMADVYFVFRQSDDGSVQKIPAHKFVLSIGSAVFEAMFRFDDNSSAASTNGNGNSNAICIQEVELPDVERQAFEALLAFLYTDSSQAISKDTVMSILYTAKKYAVPALENACINFLETCLNSENAFMLLAKARFYDEERLAKQCLAIIDEEANEALKSDDFLGIDQETLCILLRRNTLRMKELTLFNAVKRWAQEKCRQRSLPSTAENQRNVLGNALYLIRFPLINPTDFAKHVAPTKLLSDAEMVSVFLYYHTGPQQPLPFSLSYRGLYTPEMIVNRFQRVESSWGYTGTPDRVNMDIGPGPTTAAESQPRTPH